MNIKEIKSWSPEIEKEITRGLDVTFVSHMDQVMDILLLEDENHADH